MLDNLFQPKKGKAGVTTRIAYDENFDLYEVHMNDKPVDVFKKKKDADRAVIMLERAFEEGLINGLLLAKQDPSQVKPLLDERGVNYERQAGKSFSFEKYNAWRKKQGLPVEDADAVTDNDLPFDSE